MNELETKYFTPKEAQKTLPLVKRIVEDILSAGNEIKKIAGIIEGNLEEDKEILALSDLINSYMNELEELGCYFKDWNFTIGLVDFPSVIDNEEVYLCWRSDEEKIMYYHPVNDGFNSRKKIPDVYFE